MREKIATRARRMFVVLAVSAVGLMAFAGNALATAYQFDAVTDPVEDQITEVLSVGLPLGAGLLALFIGWKVVKRLSRG